MREVLNLVVDDSLNINGDDKKIYIHPFKRKTKKNENFVILNYHWNDYNKLSKDYIYLEKFRLKLVSNLGQTLNNFHKVKYSNRFWETLIGGWAHSFCIMIFDRWEMISDLNKMNNNFNLNLKKYSDKDMIIQTIDELNSLNYLNDFNSYLFSKIINFRFPSNNKFFIKYFEKEPSELINEKKKFRNFNRGKKSIIVDFYRRIFSKILTKQKYAILRPYLGIKDEFKLNFMLKQLPCSIPNNYFNCEPDLDLRSNLILENKSKNDFENFIYKKIIFFIPTSFLEGFNLEKKKIENLKLPRNPITIFSSNIFAKSLLCRYCAEKIENGAKLILGVHGGCYGHFDIHFSEDHETRISDVYLTWGWKKKDRDNVKPFGIIRPKTNFKRSKKPDLLTMIIPAKKIFTERIESDIAFKHNKKLIFDPCFKILNNLNEKIKNENLLIRFYNRNFGSFEYEEFEDKYPNIKKDKHKIKYNDLISQTRIFLSPYLGTGYLETLSINLPTIIFLKKTDIIRDEAKPHYEMLKKVNIFFDDEIKLANHINNTWNNYSEWWDSKILQETVKKFCNIYAYTNNNKIRDLKKIILNK